ncbi:MAG: hypothetical protein ACETWD_06775, partial [Desulfatiglandales bacterium]
DHTPCYASPTPVRRRTDTHLLKSTPAPWPGRPGSLTFTYKAILPNILILNRQTGNFAYF